MRALAIAVCTGCSFTPPAGPGPGDDQPPPNAIVIALDSAAELAGTGDNRATLERSFVGPSGSVEPIAYVHGVLSARAVASRLFNNAATGAWSQIDGAAVVGRALRNPDGFLQVPNVIPSGLGLTVAADFCVFYEGEIFLEAGTHRFEIAADHDAFLEIGDGIDFQRVVNAKFDIPNFADAGMYVAAAAGWHPVRIALCQDAGDGGLLIDHRPPDGGLAKLAPRRLRTIAHDVAGTSIQGFDELFATALVDQATTIDEANPYRLQWTGTVSPTGADGSHRVAGQVLVADSPGVVFAVAATTEHRLWVDGELRSPPSTWRTNNQNPTTSMTEELALTAGWHDVAVDVSPAGNRTGSVSVAFATTGQPPQPINLAHARPVAGAHRVIAVADDGRTSGFNINGGSSIAIDAVVDPVDSDGITAVFSDLDVSIVINGSNNSSYRNAIIELVTPSGTAVTVFDDAASQLTNTNTLGGWFRLTAPEPASGRWQLRITSRGGSSQGTIIGWSATLHLRAGPDVYPRSATYTSPLVDLGRDAQLIRTLDASATAALGVALSGRSCSTASVDSCGPWVSAADLEAGLGARGSFAQLRADLVTDGVHGVFVDKLELWALP